MTLADSENPPVTVSRSFTLEINQIAITPGPTLANAKLGVAYRVAFKTEGSVVPLIWDCTGGLPPGLTYSSSGVLSGKPTTAGQYTFAVEVDDDGGNNTAEAVTVTG